VKNVQAGDSVEVMVLGQPHRATILSEPPFDPTGARLRS
jgi:dimethylglycine dehydrogenase